MMENQGQDGFHISLLAPPCHFFIQSDSRGFLLDLGLSHLEIGSRRNTFSLNNGIPLQAPSDQGFSLLFDIVPLTAERMLRDWEAHSLAGIRWPQVIQ